jgi:EF hand
MPLSLQGSLNWLTRTKSFRRLTKWAFVQCDASGNGKLTKTELYGGILLVHLQLAKYAGAAACYPPSKIVIDQLFDASDDDKSGYIDEDEFIKIMVICCAQIASRIIVYFAILVLLANVLAEYIITGLANLDEYMGWNVAKGKGGMVSGFFAVVESFLTFGELAQNTLSLLLFFVVVPMIFDYIDNSSNEAAKCTVTLRGVVAAGATTTATNTTTITTKADAKATKEK